MTLGKWSGSSDWPYQNVRQEPDIDLAFMIFRTMSGLAAGVTLAYARA
jgi:hypothetical protein